MPFIRLGDQDREYFGCDEWLPFDERVLTNEAEAFESFGGNLTAFTDAKKVAWWRAMVWLTLFRAGVKKAYDDIQFDLNALRIEDNAGGKALSETDVSATSQTSVSSTPRSRRTRSKS